MQRTQIYLTAALTLVLPLAGCSPTSGGTETTASAEPSASSVALGSLVYGLDGDIYVADWDGANAVRIADGRPANECGGIEEYFGAGWSADGRYLAYRNATCQASGDEWWDVVISDPEGNVVASFPSEGWLIPWSPDSTRVAVWVRWGETIGVYGLDGVRQALITVPPGWMPSGDVDPEWLPGGESLLLANAVEIPLDGSAPRRLPWDGETAWTTYSPDGSRVAYTTLESFVVAAADGSNPQEVFGHWAGSPVWSPTGDRIAFSSNGFHQLHMLELATGTLTLLAEGWRVGTPQSVEPQAGDMLWVKDFSPEGDRILFSRIEDEGAGTLSLWSVNADGSDLRRLVAGTAEGDWWSPSQTP